MVVVQGLSIVDKLVDFNYTDHKQIKHKENLQIKKQRLK